MFQCTDVAVEVVLTYSFYLTSKNNGIAPIGDVDGIRAFVYDVRPHPNRKQELIAYAECCAAVRKSRSRSKSFLKK